MAKEVFIPKLGQTVEEVTLVKWLVPDGARVEQGQEILEVETDKAIFTVEASGKGYIHIGPYPEGQAVPVLEVVAIIGKQDEKFGRAAGAADMSAAPAAPAVAVGADLSVRPAEPTEGNSRIFASPRARKLAEEKVVDLSQVTPTGGGGVRVAERDVLAYLAAAPKATPLAQRVAAEAGVDLHGIAGTGPNGRITRGDVQQIIQPPAEPAFAPGPVPAPTSGLVAQPIPPVTPSPAADVLERVPLKGVRGIIADRMGSSVHTTARVTLMMQIDATEFVTVRERLKAQVAEEWGFAPGYNDLLAKIAAMALHKFPYMNARLTPDAIERLGAVNIGMAVDTERGLLVPVIRHADQKSLRQFGAEFRERVERARKGRSLPDDLGGGTFTLTNLGMFDVDAFTPVINLPEAAILGVGRIAPQWVYRPDHPDGPVLRQMWTLSLVFDHRIVDGAPAARFLQYIKRLIEEPYLMLAE